jgi:DNA-binding IclR family transcriptional regulator
MSIAVLDKTFSLLEVLARMGRAATLADLARESRLPKPTAYRILRSLRDLGYVVQSDRGGAYSLSERLQSLGEQGRDESLREKAAPLMRRLHAEFDETVNLGVLEGIYVRYAWVLETTHALRWGARLWRGCRRKPRRGWSRRYVRRLRPGRGVRCGSGCVASWK